MTTLEHPGHGHGHGAPIGDEPILSHHFDDVEQQHESSNLGMWAFLATEVMFFGGLIFAYVTYRNLWSGAQAADPFVQASRHLNVPLGAFNTIVLLTSSLTMALAVRAAQLRDAQWVVRYLLLTMLLGTAFLGVKAIEWTADYHERLIPGINWDWAHAQAETGHAASNPAYPDGPRPLPADPSMAMAPGLTGANESGRAQMFFVLYFFMTGLHALHLIIGIGLLGVIARLAHRGWFSGGGATQVEMTGLYWHFIDIVWVFLYPLLYLIDVHK